MPTRNPNTGDLLLDEAEFDAFARARHTRYFELNIVYHIISRTNATLFLLTPDLEGELRRIVAGVLAEARENQFKDIANFATSLMSNHHHLLAAARGQDPRRIADYMRFFKSETCRRWNKEIGWTGSIWEGYMATAVITPAAQIRALEYTLGQGVKEKLIADPRDWPGFHCAESLCSGEPIRGHWFDGTGYGRAYHADLARKKPRGVDRAEFTHAREFSFDKLPALEHLSDDAYRATMVELVEDIVAEGEITRAGREPLGPEGVCAVDRMTRKAIPIPPWFENRKRMVVWDDHRDPEVQVYLERYWAHQRAHREARGVWKETTPQVSFPDYSFVPGLRPRPIAHMEQSTA